MAVRTWQGIIVALIALSLFPGCASSPYVGTGAALGGGVGAVSGAAIARSNPWAGAIVGGLLGSALGAGGGYLLQQRQQQQYGPPQGYYPAQPEYGAPAPPAYGQYAPAPGPDYGYSAQTPTAPADPNNEWVLAPGAEIPPVPGYDNGSAPQAAPPPYNQAPEAYSQAPQDYSQAPLPPGAGTPPSPDPYYSQQAWE
jgi:hypothetical protein